MRIEHLEYLICLAETHSTKQAARHLFTSHQNVSKVLRQMESELEAELFRRVPKGLELTEAGEIMLKSAKAIVNEFNSAKQKLSKFNENYAVSGELHIYGTSMTHLTTLVPLSSAFRDVFSNIILHFHEYETLEVLKQVALHPQSVAIVPLLTNEEYQFIYEPYLNGLALTPLYNDRFICIVSKNSSLAGQTSISLRKFVQYPLVLNQLQAENESGLLRLFYHYGNPKIALSTGNSLLYTQAILDGQGIGISSQLAHKGNTFTTDTIAIPFREDMHVNVALVTAVNKQLSPQGEAFVQFAKQYYNLSN